MSDLLEQLLADLDRTGDRLDHLVADLDDTGWATPTPAAGWTIAHQIAHLSWTDDAAIAAATDKDAWDALVTDALDSPEDYVDRAAESGAEQGGAELLVRWRGSRQLLAEELRNVPAGTRLPWFGPPMSPASMATARLMETWAHGVDVADALGAPTEATDAIRHVAHLGVRTRDFAFGVHGLTPPAEEFRIDLVAPSEDVWSWGPDDAAQTITGSAEDFCLLVTQRRNRADLDVVAHGPDAERWLGIAQAFAGPPGPGREPAGAAG